MSNKVTNLEDFRPKTSSFVMHSNGKTYQLRELDAATECSIIDKFGKSVQEVMEAGNQSGIYEIAFRLLKDKSDFLAEEIEEIDELGMVKKHYIGGVEKFKRALTGGAKEALSLASAITIAIYGKSAEELISAANKITDIKKKTTKKK